MKHILFILGVLAITTSVLVACNTTEKKETSTDKKMTKEELVKRGEYLVAAVGCDDCHTPKKMGPQGPEPDMTLRFSGHPSGMPIGPTDSTIFAKGWVNLAMDLTSAYGPWGTSFSANLSSDSTGIGMWTEEQFFRAIRKGLSKGLEGNRPLMPPMPWMMYKNFNDEDLRSIFEYLKSSKPVKNVVPAYIPSHA
jgi:hypothetical protein